MHDRVFRRRVPDLQREIAFYKSRVDGAEVAFVDATSCDVSLLGKNLDRDAALKRIHVRRADGTLVSGAAGFAELWKSVPGFGWMGQLASIKPVAFVLERVYRVSL